MSVKECKKKNHDIAQNNDAESLALYEVVTYCKVSDVANKPNTICYSEKYKES